MGLNMVAAIGSSCNTCYSTSGNVTGAGSGASKISGLRQQLASLQQQLVKTQCVQTQKALTQQIATVQSNLAVAEASSGATGQAAVTSNSSNSLNANTTNSTTATQGNLINITA